MSANVSGFYSIVDILFVIASLLTTHHLSTLVGNQHKFLMLKRCFDFVVALLALALLSPLLLALALLVYWRLGAPVLFRQQRPGWQEQPFYLIKFRSMLNEQSGLSEQQRLTRFGRWLRGSSLDELPELWNVLKGDMALVGPRPLLMQYLPLYSAEQRRRHLVRPGITGWAQVNGRNAISWEQKFALDTWYVDNQSFWLDIRILLLTVKAALRREGINSTDDQLMPPFTGGSDIGSTAK